MKQTLPLNNAFFTLKKAQQVFLVSILILGFNLFFIQKITAQDITFNVKSYKGGYNVSCNGSSNGNIDATIVGGTSPYTYSWSNGSSTQDLSNIAAGVYTLTVTDAIGSTKSKSITLFEADVIEVFFTTSIYEGGYQISKMGNNDGSISTDVKGGAPPYKYLWNTGATKANLDKLTAGAYSVVITDQNGCSVTQSVTLIEPTPLTVSLTAATFGSYNTSCFESKDGSINLSVSGGMPPYRFNWSNGSFEEDLSNISSGAYKVQVTDANKATVGGQITLTQPDKLEVNLIVSAYSNGYNISCNNCFNGSITSVVTGGTSPSTYLWKGSGAANGQTTANLINLGPGGYNVIVTDANNCKTENRAFLSEPPSNAWDKSGSIADPTNFLGTTNSAPLVFKTSNTEGMRISEIGNVGIGTASPTFKVDVNGDMRISNGTLKLMGGLTFGTVPPVSIDPCIEMLGLGADGTLVTLDAGADLIYDPATAPCPEPPIVPFTWQTWGNHVNHDARWIGTIENYDFRVKTNSTLRMVVKKDGKIGIGTASPTEILEVIGNTKISGNTRVGGNSIIDGNVGIGTDLISDPSNSVYKLCVNGNVRAKKVVVDAGWSDFVFEKTYKLRTLPEIEDYIKSNGHLPDVPSAKEIETNGADMALLLKIQMQKIEELTLYIIEQNKRIVALENK